MKREVSGCHSSLLLFREKPSTNKYRSKETVLVFVFVFVFEVREPVI